MSHSFQICIGMELVKFKNVTFISDMDRYFIGKFKNVTFTSDMDRYGIGKI